MFNVLFIFISLLTLPSYSTNLMSLFRNAWTPASGITCETSMIALIENSPERFSELNWDTTEPTIQIVDTLSGHYGGKRQLLKKTGDSWASRAATTPRGIQGDPRWILESLGKENAKQLGFEWTSENTMVIPDAHELNAALDKLSAVLQSRGKEPIAMRFYEQSKFNMSNYNDRFTRGELPFADETTHRLHDISFHTGSVFLPKRVIDHTSYLIKEVNIFVDALGEEIRSKKPIMNPHEERALKYFLSTLRQIITVNIDVGTGTITPHYLDTQTEVLVIDANRKKDVTKHLSNFNQFSNSIDSLYFIHPLSDQEVQKAGYQLGSAAGAILSVLRRRESQALDLNMPLYDSHYIFLNHLLDDTHYDGWITNFTKQHIQKRAETDPNFLKTPPLSSKEACKEMVGRILDIREALQQLSTPRDHQKPSP